jgi:squalene-associated FAD-dependent desaturase
MSKPHVIVVGGGLAGLSAALSCADGGSQVTLLEARPRLGGLTWSFEREGLSFDNGQHVYLRCCTEYQRFLRRIGSDHLAPLQRQMAVPVVRPGRHASWLRSDPLPAPVHLARSLLTYRHLGIIDRLGLGRAALALRRLRLDDPSLDEQTFGDWLSRHGQSPEAISGLWDLITLPTVNLRASRASLALAAKVFQTGLLSDARAGDIGWSRVPLARLHGEPAMVALSEAGADVRLRTKVAAIEAGDGTAGHAPMTVVADGERIDADAVVLAVPHHIAADLLPPGSIPNPESLLGLGFSPIVGVNLVYDRKVMGYEIAAGLGTTAQFVFDRSVASGLAASPGRGGQCLAVSISSADHVLGTRPEDLIELVSRAICDLFPVARPATLVDAVVTRERMATFCGEPGTQALRHGARTRYPHLLLAGAWTDTGWPATMEGAVRSGNTAASLALDSVGNTRRRTGPRARLEETEEVVA